MGKLMKFEFVNTTQGPESHDAEYKSQVRKSSMRAYRRRQRLERMDQYMQLQGRSINEAGSAHPEVENVSSREPSHPAEATTRIMTPKINSSANVDKLEKSSRTFQNREEEVKAQVSNIPTRTLPLTSYAPSPRSTTLSPSGINPFDTVALRLPPEYDLFINHFHNIIGPLILPMPMRSNELTWASAWLAKATSEPDMLLATLHQCAIHLDRLYDRPASVTTMRLKCSTIAMIQASMDKTPNRQSDGLICAVLMMAASSIVEGDYEELVVHTTAAQSLIRSRFTSSVPDEWNLVETSAWCNEAPTAVLLAPHFLLEPMGVVWTSPTQTVSSCARLSIPQLFSRIRRLMQMQKAALENGGATVKQVRTFSYQRFAIDHYLLSMRSAAFDTSQGSLTEVLEKCCWTATLAFNQYVLRKYDPRLPVINTLMSELHEDLCVLHQRFGNEFKEVDARLLLWISSICGALSVRHHGQALVTQLTASCTRKLGLSTPQDVQDVLHEYAWIETLCEDGIIPLFERLNLD